jgi:hypothetical protein
MEPAHDPPDGAGAAQRMLAGWLVTREPMRPVASHEDDATHAVRWERPWTDGESYRVPPSGLRAVLGDGLGAVIPEAGALVVQTFHDLRSSRDGFGDVVFAPRVPAKSSDAEVEARRFRRLRRPLQRRDPPPVPARSRLRAHPQPMAGRGSRSEWPSRSSGRAELAASVARSALLARSSAVTPRQTAR